MFARGLPATVLLPFLVLPASTPANEAMQIPHGFCCDAGRSANGWFAAIKLIDQPDEPFRSEAAAVDYDEAARTVRNWQTRFLGRPRRLVLVTANADGPRELAAADRLFGPVCPRLPCPTEVVVWTQRVDDVWTLQLYHGGQTRTVWRSSEVLTRPAICVQNDRPVLACETNTGGTGTVLFFPSPDGQPIRITGRAPQLAASSNRVLLLTEAPAPNRIALHGRIYIDGAFAEEITVPQRDDYAFNADVVFDQTAERFLVVCESCPAFGMNDLFGQHRDLDVYTLPTGANSFSPFPARNNRLPDPRYAFRSLGVENATPIRPRVFIVADSPVIGYHRFRYRGRKTFGWDIMLSRFERRGWGRAVRVSETYGMPDTGFAIVENGQSLLTVFAACDQRGRSSACTSHRVEIVPIERSAALPDIEIPLAERGEYVFPLEPARDVAPAPPPLRDVPGQYQLIFGDTHQHSTYSKCMSAYNGMPDEVLRYERDVLDLDVLCLSEHGHYLSGPSIVYTLDHAEAAAGEDRILLFATEPGTTPGRHTNYFAADRNVFERLQLITLAHRYSRADIYRQIKEDLPAGSVVAARHFHGKAVKGAEELRASFDPEIEVAMEGMQGRVNAMLPGQENGRKAELFPTNFLNAGCRVGIIGGTDHYRGDGPNHFCLTGFWVREKTGAGVLEAMRSRRTVGMSDAKIALWAELAGAPMGSEVTVDGPVQIAASVAAARPVRRACLIRDGELLPWQPVTAGRFTLTDPNPPSGNHWYVVTVEAETAYADTAVAHASPFFTLIP